MRTQGVGANKYAFDRAPIRRPTAAQTYRVELPLELLDEQGQLLDWVIGYAFDTLDAHHLDLRIVATLHSASLQ